MFQNKVILLLLLALSAFASCKKDSNDEDTGTMTATIDGKSWTATQVAASIIGGYINVTGQTASGELITITISDDQKGTYTMDETTLHALAYNEKTGANSHASNGDTGAGGKAVVSDINFTDSTITGTFECIVIRPIDNSKVTITNGKFTNVKFKTELPNTGGSSTLTCKIDGVAFAPTTVFGSLALGKIIITGSSSNGQKSIGLTLIESATVGSHDFEFFGDYIAQYNPDQSTFLSADSGKVNITKHDKTNKRIEGTFNFVASEFGGGVSATITEGVFKVSY